MCVHFLYLVFFVFCFFKSIPVYRACGASSLWFLFNKNTFVIQIF